MALKTVTGKLTRPDGATPASLFVNIKLSGAAVITGTQEVVPARVTPVVAPDGTYSVQLQANNDLTPNGTYYVVTEEVDGEQSAFNIVVPQTAGPFVMSSIQTGLPPLASPGVGRLSSLTVDGAATFTAGPVSVPDASFTEAKVAGLVADLAVLTADDANTVHRTGNEVIAGQKTLSNRLTTSADFVHSHRVATEAELVSGLDASLAETIVVTLTANRVMGVPINGVDGHRVKVVLIEGGVGGFTLDTAAISVTNWALNLTAGRSTELPIERIAGTWTFASNPASHTLGTGGTIYDKGGQLYNSGAYADLTTALTAAPAGSDLWVNGLNNLTVVLNLKRAVNLRGNYRMSQPAGGVFGQPSEIHQSTGAQNILNTVDTGAAVSETQQIAIEGVALTGGQHGIFFSNGGIEVTLTNVSIYNHTGKGLYLKGFIQELLMTNFEVSGGDIGIYHNNENGSVTTTKLMDKCRGDGVWLHGQSINAMSIQVSKSYNVKWDHLRTQVAGQDGVIIGGNLQGWIFDDWNAESNGASAAVAVVTTATTSGGSANVTVASGAGINNGMVVTIAGAGAAGADWYPTVSSGGGTVNLVMTTTAPTAVTSAELTTALYSDLKIVQTNGSAPVNVLVEGASIGTGNRIRYAIDTGSDGGGVIVVGGSSGPSGRPIYDAYSVVTVIGADDNQTEWPIRRPIAYNGGAWRTIIQGPTALYCGTGVPPNANGQNGSIFIRIDGGAGTAIYQKRAGAWVATAA